MKIEMIDPIRVCPFCANENITCHYDERVLTVKGIPVPMNVYFYRCEDCKEQFTTTKADEKTLEMLIVKRQAEKEAYFKYYNEEDEN